MEQLKFVIVGIVIFGGVIDFLTQRIPNWWTFSAILAGLAAQAYLAGLSGLSASFLGVALGFALFFPLYAFRIMGAGDVKLLMAVGAWSNWNFVLTVAVASILVGGAFAAVEVVWRGRARAMWGNFLTIVRAITIQGFPRPTLDIDTKRKFSFGVALAAAVILVVALEQRGVLP